MCSVGCSERGTRKLTWHGVLQNQQIPRQSTATRLHDGHCLQTTEKKPFPSSTMPQGLPQSAAWSPYFVPRLTTCDRSKIFLCRGTALIRAVPPVSRTNPGTVVLARVQIFASLCLRGEQGKREAVIRVCEDVAAWGDTASSSCGQAVAEGAHGIDQQRGDAKRARHGVAPRVYWGHGSRVAGHQHGKCQGIIPVAHG